MVLGHSKCHLGADRPREPTRTHGREFERNSFMGIEGIDLYGFDGYFQIEMEDVRGIYRDTANNTKEGSDPQTCPLFILTIGRDVGIWTPGP
jgi:hypothetical protein